MEVLGSKSSRISILASASLALLSLFYVYAVGSFFQIRIYPLKDRVTYLTPFDLHVINEYVDSVVIGSLLFFWLAISIRKSNTKYIGLGLLGALFVISAVINNDQALAGITLAALPALVSLVAYDRYSPRKILVNQCNGLTLNYLAIIGIVTGIIALAFGVALVIFGSAVDEAPVRNYAYEIFLFFSSFSPVLILLLITAFPIKLLINYISNSLRKKRAVVNSEQYGKDFVSPKAKIVYLSLFAFLSILMTIIPHLPTVNIDNQLIGVDTAQYNIWTNALRKSENAYEFLYQAFVEFNNGDRPISVIFVYGFQQLMIIFGQDNYNSALLIEYMPILLGPSLVLIIYLLAKQLTGNERVSLIAAFLTSISFHVLIGIYAGFYANWIALIFGYLSIVFLFRFFKGQRTIDLALYGVILVLTLFSHVYTWSIFAIIIGIFLTFYMVKKNYYHSHNANRTGVNIEKKSIIIAFIVLLCSVGIDVGRMVITGSTGGIEKDLQLGSELASLEQFVLRWNNLTYTTTIYVGGLFANFIVLGLGLYWLARSDMQKSYNIFLIVTLSVGILPFLFGEWVIQTRVLYNVPFQIPAALALVHMKDHTNGLLRSIPIYIWLIAISIITVSNFYFVLPEVQQLD